MEMKAAIGIVGEIQGGLPSPHGFGHAAQELGGEPVEGDPRGEVRGERPPLLAVVVLLGIEMGADVPPDPPAKAVRERQSSQAHHGYEDDQGAEERRLGKAEGVEEPSGGAGQKEIEAT